jgi:outer membrane protein OmpA-like peptidoglycan-associated protein
MLKEMVMKTSKPISSATSMSAFTTLAIVMAKGAEAEQKSSCSIPAKRSHHGSSHASQSRNSHVSKSILIAGFVSATLFAAGCTTTDPDTGDRKMSRTTRDAGIGAVAGAVLGAATSSHKDRGRGALTGAAVGGAIGGVIGHRADKQEAQLREKLANSGVEVQRQGDTINLVVPGAISFATNSAQLAPDFYESLNKVAVSLKEYPDSNIQIIGHTDSTGAAAYNQQLSVNRAAAVVIYLGAQGVSQARMQAVGMAASQPIADNKTAEGRAKNRRVEIKIIPRETTEH